MKTRLITAFIGAILFLTVLFSPPIVFQAAVIIVAGIATYEAYSVTGIIKKAPLAISGCFGVLWCALLGCMHLNSLAIPMDICLLCITLHAATLLALMVFCHNDIKLHDAATGFFINISKQQLIVLVLVFMVHLKMDILH